MHRLVSVGTGQTPRHGRSCTHKEPESLLQMVRETTSSRDRALISTAGRDTHLGLPGPLWSWDSDVDHSSLKDLIDGVPMIASSLARPLKRDIVLVMHISTVLDPAFVAPLDHSILSLINTRIP